MQKINFQNLPSTTTPINATNLNEMQNNVEDVFNGSETMGNIVVGSIKTKNLFNKETLIAGDIIDIYPSIRLSSRQPLWLEAGTYIFSTNLSSTFQYAIQVQNVGVPPLSAYPDPYIYNSGWQSASSLSFTLTTAGYFILGIRRANNSDLTLSEIKDFNYQLEKGSTATAYTPYQDLNNQEIYTKGEQKIGTWVDGKTLYRRCFEIPQTTISSSSTTAISIPTGNVNIVNIGGYVFVGTSQYRYPITGFRNLDYGVRNLTGGTQLLVGTSLSSEGTIKGVAIIEYTK